MPIRRHLGFTLNITALALFFPGILLPMFALNMELAATLNISRLSSTIIDKELSIMQTVADLWQDDRLLVAALIFIFSVCIPLFKTCCVALAYFKRGRALERKLINFVAHIGKWSMADVFVVAVFLAVLSTNHADTSNAQQLNMLGFMVDINISSETLSSVGEGFYFFAAYCILSLLATHIYWSATQQSKSG